MAPELQHTLRPWLALPVGRILCRSPPRCRFAFGGVRIALEGVGRPFAALGLPKGGHCSPAAQSQLGAQCFAAHFRVLSSRLSQT
eukprot:6126859-Prymnesium_polylepis.1